MKRIILTLGLLVVAMLSITSVAYAEHESCTHPSAALEAAYNAEQAAWDDVMEAWAAIDAAQMAAGSNYDALAAIDYATLYAALDAAWTAWDAAYLRMVAVATADPITCGP